MPACGGSRPTGACAAFSAVPESERTSEAARLPAGHGPLYVDPKTLPAGRFLAYDHGGRLVSTIYMVPLRDLDEHKKFAGLGAVGASVDQVDIYFNAGHQGVEQPHYHIVLWHVPKADEAAVAK